MTLPTLIANYKNKVLLYQAKNSYSIISNAMQMVKSHNNLDSYGDLFNNSYTDDEIIDILSKDLKMVKICKKNKGGCWTWDTKANKKMYVNGQTFAYNHNYLTSAILEDGSVIYVTRYNHNGDCKWENTYNKTDAQGNPIKDADGNNVVGIIEENRCGAIGIDVNGKKGPNQMDADTWTLDIYPQKVTAQYHSFLYDDNLHYEKYNVGEPAN